MPAMPASPSDLGLGLGATRAGWRWMTQGPTRTALAGLPLIVRPYAQAPNQCRPVERRARDGMGRRGKAWDGWDGKHQRAPSRGVLRAKCIPSATRGRGQPCAWQFISAVECIAVESNSRRSTAHQAHPASSRSRAQVENVKSSRGCVRARHSRIYEWRLGSAGTADLAACINPSINLPRPTARFLSLCGWNLGAGTTEGTLVSLSLSLRLSPPPPDLVIRNCCAVFLLPQEPMATANGSACPASAPFVPVWRSRVPMDPANFGFRSPRVPGKRELQEGVTL